MDARQEEVEESKSLLVPETVQSEATKCPHYVRRCHMLMPCCKKMYPCRLCHDSTEDHEVNRFEVETLLCTQCGTEQAVASHCQDCSIMFGMYSCTKCRLFDDADKGQFHCSKCELCRVGGKDKFFHCDQCGICLSINIRDTHKCRSDSGKDKCPVCFESVYTSTEPSLVPGCGHLIHSKCHRLIMEYGHKRCPYCNQNYEKMNQASS